MPLFSRGPSRRAGLCASDPDGGWYVREGDHREREDDKGKPLRKLAWALEATIATTARPPHAEPACPNLAIGLAMTRPGEDPGGTGARVLASAAARGHKTGWLGYDRACTQALPGRFHLPARALGYSPVMDYRDDQLGIQASTGGAILVEGTWYCPALPGPLITATTELRGHAITRELYDQQITARACYCWPPFLLSVKSASGVIAGEGHLRRCDGRLILPSCNHVSGCFWIGAELCWSGPRPRSWWMRAWQVAPTFPGCLSAAGGAWCAGRRG